ncbi:cobyric acid synthase [Paenibacillus sp. y28]
MNGVREASPAKPVPARTIMVQGTSSDAGKSILTTALCRILKQDGWRVAPFKSQNMSLNSYVTPDGKEIGRAQGMQADACGIAATTDMNPILLKPKKDMVSQVVVHGKPLQDYDARSYREKYLPEAGRIVQEALARLRGSCDVVVLEGAGSPAEINLKDRDIVNMRAASWAEAPVILVADIDRGGVFASLVGTMDILNPDERARVKGFVINKFRGDVTLLKPGLDWLENRTGVPVLGVIPHLPNLGLEDEDSASLDAKQGAGSAADAGFRSDGASAVLDIAVLRLPRLSNFTDFDPLPEEPDVRMRYITSPEQWGTPDAVILPGSKNTVEDLLYLRESGLEALLQQHVREGGAAVGICAGYQMMGARLLDPERCESDRTETEGLGWLPAETEFYADKRTERVQGTVNVALLGWSGDVPQNAGLASGLCEVQVEGYEIHMGRTRFTGEVRQPFLIRDTRLGPQAGKAAVDGRDPAGPPDSQAGVGQSLGRDYQESSFGTRQQGDTSGGPDETGGRTSHGPASMASTGSSDAQGPFHADGASSRDGLVWGTYIHGILHNDVFRRAWLNRLRRCKGWAPLQEVQPFGLRREQAFDRLADHVRSHLAMERIYEMIGITHQL